jgi:hypothetical protein
MALALLLPAAASADLPSGYSPLPYTSPEALAGDHFGASVANMGDLNGDGWAELAIGAPDAPVGSGTSADPRITGKVYLINGASGGPYWKAEPPTPDAAKAGSPTAFGTTVSYLGDIGACTGSGSSCQIATVPDGWPEVLVSAPGGDLGGETGKDQGIVYVLDGKTGKTMKRIQLSDVTLPSSGLSGFGQSLLVPAGEPPCGENGLGIGACPANMPDSVAIGDLDGGGVPDIVIGAPGFTETADNPSACTEELAACPGAGRVFIFSGESITGSSLTPLTTPSAQIQAFEQPGNGRPPAFGTALAPLGDVGGCNAGQATVDARCYGPGDSAPSSVPDGVPDFLVSSAGSDTASADDAGAVYVIEGQLLTAITRQDNPGAGGAAVLPSLNAPLGDLGGSALPDVAVGAPAFSDGQGATWSFDGDVTAGLPLIARLDDPAPAAQAAFGGSVAGIGDVAGDAQAEIAVGRTGASPAVEIFSACRNSRLQRIDDPSGQPGSQFGASIVPAGDANNDSFLDLAVSAPGFSAGQGAVYLMLSDHTAGPAFAGCNPTAGGGGGGGGGSTSGGGSAAGGGTNPGGSGKVTNLARRTISLRMTPAKIKFGKSVKVLGRIRISSGRAACRSRQKVAVQRQLPGTDFFQTFDVAVTNKKGAFRMRMKPEKSFTYRLRLSQTSRCQSAVSRTSRVRVRGGL